MPAKSPTGRSRPRSSAQLLERLRALKHVAMDLDGTLYRGGRLFPQTLPFLATLTRLQVGYTFLTNNSSLSCRDYVKKLRAMALPATLANIRTSTQVTVDYLRRRHPRARTLLALGTASLRTELRAAGYRLIDPDAGRHRQRHAVPDAVLVGFDTECTYDRLCLACAWVAEGKPFLATHPDMVCPSAATTVLVDCGAICATITAATGVTPVALGKPNPALLQQLCREQHIRPAQMAMIGDRLYTDIAMANRAGALGILVLTGESTRQAARRSPAKPDAIYKHIGQFAAAITQAHRT